MKAGALRFTTDFADQAVLLPLLAVVALVLLATRERRAAAAWTLAVAGTFATVLVAKVVCYACGWMVPAFAADRWAVRSPSGHVAAASVVYAGIALLLAGSLPGRGAGKRMGLAVVASATVAAVIGTTRSRLGAHSVAEVLVAAAIGTAGAALFAATSGPLRDRRIRWPVVGVLVLVWVLFHGLNLPAEAAIRDVLGEQLRQWIVGRQAGPA